MDLGKLREVYVHRVCGQCGKKFETYTKNGETVTALQQFSDHLTEHQPDGAAWTRAYKIIEANRPKKKQD